MYIVHQKHIIIHTTIISDVRWALQLEKMRDTSNNMSTATRNTRLSQSLSVFVQQNKARNILYVIMKKLHIQTNKETQKSSVMYLRLRTQRSHLFFITSGNHFSFSASAMVTLSQFEFLFSTSKTKLSRELQSLHFGE